MNNEITTEILVDVSNGNHRWTCFKVRYPRFIMAEVNTHRMLSKVSASSRAIPTAKLIERVRKDPFIPIHFGENKRGMQAINEVSDEARERATQQWKLSAFAACLTAEGLERLGVHKQVVNRVLEPYLTVETLIAGTEWGNFFKLRASKEAQPEFACLAYKMLELYCYSTPVRAEEWCGPFMDKMPPGISEYEMKDIVAARVARISYSNFSGEINIKDDLRLANQLKSNGHMTPFEFIVHPINIAGASTHNLKGFYSYRATLKNESHNNKNIPDLLGSRPLWSI